MNRFTLLILCVLLLLGIVFSYRLAVPASHSGKLVIPPGVDRATYVSLCDADQDCGYGRDRKFVYYHGKIVQGADPASFQLLDLHYATDATHVFYVDPSLSGPAPIGGDPPTFKNLGGNALYTKDANQVFWQNAPLLGADSSTFSNIHAGDIPTTYGMDTSNVYHNGQIIPGADPRTFHIISVPPLADPQAPSDGYSADARHVYDNGVLVPGANPATFVPPTPTPAPSPSPSPTSANSSPAPNSSNPNPTPVPDAPASPVPTPTPPSSPAQPPVYPNGVIKDPNGF